MAVTPLSLYIQDTASSTLATALTLIPASGSASLTHTTTLLGTATGYGELFSQGTASAWAAAAAIGAVPSGNGLLYDTTALEGQTIVAGSWNGFIRLAVSAGTASAQPHIRYWVRHSDGTYTLIVDDNTSNAFALTTTFTTFTLATHSTTNPVSFGLGDKLYIDVWLNVTANSTGSGTATLEWGSLSQTAGVGDTGNTFATPGYEPSPLAGLSLVSPYVYKQQVVQVFSPAGVYIDTWRDAPLLAGVKFAINSATSPLQVTLPRSFVNFDEAGAPGARGSIAQGNIVQYWLFGPGLPATGLLKFQGVIDAYAPEITEQGEERVTVTLVPLDSVVGDNGLLGGQTFGTAGVPGSYVDPLSMFDWWFSNNDPLTSLPYTGALSLDPSNPSSSGVTSQYTFLNQNLGSIFETVRAMLPANWYWRVNQNKTVTRNVPPVTAQHQFTLGRHIVAPQYKKDWMKLKNVAQVIGTGLTTALTSALVNGTPYTSLSVAALPVAVVAGQTLVLNNNGNPTQNVVLSAGAASGATSVSVVSFTANGAYPAQTQVTLQVSATAQGSDLATFGPRVVQDADNRVVDQNTAQTLANALITQYDQMLLRTTIRVVDYRGDAQTGVGYDIETIEPGDTCQILDPLNQASASLWDEAEWDVADWDYSPSGVLQAVVVIVAVTYNFDYVDLTLAAFMPSQDIDLLAIRTTLQDFTLAS